jgi:ribosomal protein S18 acetylase RimI-like enzyme
VVEWSSKLKNSAVGTDVAPRWIGSRVGPFASQMPTDEFEVPKSMPHAGVMRDAPSSLLVLDFAVECERERDYHQISWFDKSGIFSQTVVHPAKRGGTVGVRGQLEIRYARADDIGQVVKVFRAVVAPLEIYSQAARDGEIKEFSELGLRSRISGDPKAVALAFAGKEPVGFSITDDQRGPIWIEWYGVAPGARGMGIGRRLIESLIAEAPVRGATKLWCDTTVNNLPSMALFEHMGFKKLCELRNHWYGLDFFLWELSL